MMPATTRTQAASRTELSDRLLDWLTDEPEAGRADLIERLRSESPLLDGSVIAAGVDRALERANGLGAISELLEDPATTEVMINGPGVVWIDRDGELIPTGVELSASEIGVLVERILGPIGLRVDRTSPIVDARLADGSRVNVVVPPLAIDGPVVTIRRFGAKLVPLDAFGPPQCGQVLRDLIASRAAMVVVGGTGAGKTTLLNALGAELGQRERVIVVEDTAELRLPGDHIVRLEARTANSEGVGEVTIRQLVRTALRMRPDRLVIGEVRGPEALDMLMALNTGHRGSLVTCHANGPTAGLRRLETLAMIGAVDLPIEVIREQLVEAIDVVVHLGQSQGGRRHVAAIAEVDSDSGHYPTTNTIWQAKK